MLPSALFSKYEDSGEVPYIFSDDGEVTMMLPGFNHLKYASSQCTEICEERQLSLQ
jgi:hypothetical protein